MASAYPRFDVAFLLDDLGHAQDAHRRIA